MNSVLLWLLSFHITTTVFVVVVVDANFLRDGFSSKVGNDAKSRMKLDDAGAAAGMSREMFLMSDKRWELHPVDVTKTTSSSSSSTFPSLALRNHCQKYLNQPILLKLSKKQGKYGLRAVGELPSGERLRGFWRTAGITNNSGGGGAIGSNFLKISYDEAIKQRLTTIEFELQLPPTTKKKNNKNRMTPSVIYSITMEPGAMNQKAVVPRGGGSVRILPQGRREGTKTTTASTIDVGKAYVTIPMRSGLVDPGWAKGRMAFRRGRSVGVV